MSGVEWPWSRRLTPMLQAEEAECGLACIAMIAEWHGHKVNLPGLRQRHPTSIKGVKLAELMAVASDLELAPRALRLDLEELSKLQLPAILHWDLNHFVVLEATGRNGAVTIVDPEVGRRRITARELGRHFTGVALELQPTPDFKPVEARTRTRLTDLWSRLLNFRGATVQILSLSILLQLTALIMPLFLQLTVDEGIAQGDGSFLTLLLVGFAIVYALNAVTKALRSWVVLTLGQSLSYQLGGNIVRHLLRLPLGYFEKRHVGDLLSRIGSIEPIQALLTQGLVNVIIDSALAITTLIVMLLISPQLTAVVAATTLAYFLFGAVLLPGLRRRSEEEIVARANEETYLMESIRAMRAVKLYGHEPFRENGWRNRYADVISAGYRSRIYEIRLGLAESLLFGAQFLLIVYLGALAILDQRLTVGLLLAFIAYRTSFTGSAVALIHQWQKWRLLGLHLDRLSDIVTTKREELRPATRARGAAPPALSVARLTFAYAPGEKPLFDQLDLNIPSGAFVAIAGPSGAGKSTLLRLLLGLLEPGSGRIVADGVPLGPATAAAWRARIGAVLQDDHLLTGTLADNIAFFDPQLDLARVEAAAKSALVHDEIMAMPMTYNSLIGDMGAALSGGQRQRIMLARALYREPDMLFLDEGTANLDEENERGIADLVARMPITRIVVAHRPALIERADIVYRLEGGRLVPAPRAVRTPLFSR